MAISDTTSPAIGTGRLRVAQALLLLFHVTGLVGLLFSHDPDFYLQFTPLTLGLTVLLLLLFQEGRPPAFWSFALTAGLLGFVVEVMGVHTGMFFGHYTYGSTLGLQLFDVPVLIGINWFMMSYVCGITARYLPLPVLAQALLGAVLMLGFDLCVEPVAGPYKFWHWTADVIPLQNFRDWFLFSFLLQLFFVRAPFVKRNVLAPFVYLLQLLFFFLLG